jgi:hypothetical protein
MMQNAEKPMAAFILSLVGGILIFVGSAVSIVWFSVGSAPFGGFWGMMGGWHGMMGSYGVPYDYLLVLSVLGLACGVIVVIGSLMLSLRPLKHVSWGVIVLIFSAVSFVSMGGWFVGAALGIAGGALGIAWRSR